MATQPFEQVGFIMKQSTFVKALKFASHAMAVKDIRYYLNGVCLELMGDSMILVGTDGHRMAYVTMTDENSGGAPEHQNYGPQHIIDGASVKILLAMFKPNSTGYLGFEFDEGNILISGDSGQAVYCSVIAGKFPDWRRVCKSGAMPKGTERIGMNADYLAAASKACGALDDTRYGGMTMTLHGETESILCRPSDLPDGITEAAVIVMPVKL